MFPIDAPMQRPDELHRLRISAAGMARVHHHWPGDGTAAGMRGADARFLLHIGVEGLDGGRGQRSQQLRQVRAAARAPEQRLDLLRETGADLHAPEFGIAYPSGDPILKAP